MLALCETVSCRRVQLLRYFGQEMDTEACGNCDTCLNPPQTWDATVAAQKLLSALIRLDRERGQKFGSGQVIEVLLGRENERSTQSRHQELSVWGIGEELSEKEWRTAIRQLLARGVIEAEGDYGVLVPGPQAGPLLRSETTIELAVDRTPAKPPRSRSGRSGGGARAAESLEVAERERFEALRTWRTSVAKEKQIPPYIGVLRCHLGRHRAAAPAIRRPAGHRQRRRREEARRVRRRNPGSAAGLTRISAIVSPQ